jgi:hypothetical protein
MNIKKRYYASIASSLGLLYFFIDLKNKWVTGFLFTGQNDGTESIFSEDYLKYIWYINIAGILIATYFLYKIFSLNKIDDNNFEKVENSNNSNSKTIITVSVLFLIIIIIGLFNFEVKSNDIENNKLSQKSNEDSIAAAEAAYADSIASAEAYSAERENAERENEINTNQSSSNLNQQDVINKIQKYYNGLQNGNIDANDFFSNNVIQYYTKTHLTPNEINELNNSGNQEFSNPEFIFNDDIAYNRSENDIIIYTINYHYKCFRESKQKFEECDVQAEIGINSNYEFVSLKEIKIDNLKFYDENGLSKINSSKNKALNFVSYNYEGSGISEYLDCSFDSKKNIEKIIYSTSKGKKIELIIISYAYNTCKVKFPNSNEVLRLSFKEDQLVCTDQKN